MVHKIHYTRIVVTAYPGLEKENEDMKKVQHNHREKRALLRTGPFLGHLGCLARALPLGGVFRGFYDFICEYYASLMIFRGRCSLRFCFFFEKWAF